MANYKLNLTGAEIDERLAQVPEIAEDVGALKSTIEDLQRQIGQGGAGGFSQAFKTALSDFMDGVAYAVPNGSALKKAVVDAMSGTTPEPDPSIVVSFSDGVLTITGISAITNKSFYNGTLALS